MDQLPKVQQCPHCGRYNNRGVTIDALILRDNKILLIKRGNEPFKGAWALPGGHIEWGESAEQTVQHEVLEETGLQAKKITFLNVYSKPERDPKQKITLAYLVEAEGEPRAGDDAKEYQWFELNNLPELGFDHRQIIEDYVKNSL